MATIKPTLTFDMKRQYKYTIKEHLHSLPNKRMLEITAAMPSALNVSARTWSRYINATTDKSQSIPAEHLATIARILTEAGEPVTMEQLINSTNEVEGLELLNNFIA